MQLLGAAAFDHFWASEEVVEAFFIWLGEFQGLLGAWLEGITKCERNPRMLNARAGAAVVVAVQEWHSDGAWMTATSLPRHEGQNWTPGVVYCDKPSDPANLEPLPISTPPKHATMQTRLMRIGTDIVQMEMVTDDGVTSQHNINICNIKIVVSLWDTRTMQNYAAKIWQTLAPHLSRHLKGFMRKSDSGSRSVRRAREEMIGEPGWEEPHKLQGCTKCQKERVRPRGGNNRHRLRQHRSHFAKKEGRLRLCVDYSSQ